MNCRKSRGTILSSMNKAMCAIALQTEARAQTSPKRKEPYNVLTEQDSFWSCDMPGILTDTPHTRSTMSFPKKKVLSEPRVKIEDDKIRGKRKILPFYLMASGNVETPGPERSNKHMTTSKYPHRRIDGAGMLEEHSKAEMLVHPHTPDSFFITDNQSSGISSREDRSSSSYYHPSVKTPSRSLQSQGWQPLSRYALLEHTKVNEISAEKKGTYQYNLERRQHQLWKPQEAVKSLTPPLEVDHEAFVDSMDCVKHYNRIGYYIASSNFYKCNHSMYSDFFGFPSVP